MVNAMVCLAPNGIQYSNSASLLPKLGELSSEEDSSFLQEVKPRMSNGGAGVTVSFLCLFFLLHHHFPDGRASVGDP